MPRRKPPLPPGYRPLPPSDPLPAIEPAVAERELEEIYVKLGRLHDRAITLEAVLGKHRGARRSAEVRAARAASKAAEIRRSYAELGGGAVARTTICERLGVSQSTVSRALKSVRIS